jgi:hypothetical protein
MARSPLTPLSLRNRHLMQEHGYDIDVLEYEELPAPYRNAVAVYHQHAGSAEPWGRWFGIGKLSMRALIDEIVADEDLAEFPSWAAYHAWYLTQGGVPHHQERWAVILSDDDYETLQDGWHRLHSYYRDGRRVVPVVWYAD